MLLAASLSLGPIRLVRRQNNPVHNALRRDIGISAGVVATVHTVLGLQVHMGGVLARYFTLPPDPTLASYLFVATNWLGLIGTILLLGLVAISNNYSIRSIGLGRWKNLQRVSYVAAALASAHGFLYLALEKRSIAVIVAVVFITAAVLAVQLAGRRIVTRR